MAICFDEDITLSYIDQAVAAGYDVPELIKRYAAVGTGSGQGGISGHRLYRFAQSPGGRPVGMALVDDELVKVGTPLNVYEDDYMGQLIPVKGAATPFYAPDGRCMKL